MPGYRAGSLSSTSRSARPWSRSANSARGAGGEDPCDVGGAGQRGVVDENEVAVRGALDVDLDGVGPLGQRLVGGGEGVLRGVGGGAAVRDDLRTGPGTVGVGEGRRGRREEGGGDEEGAEQASHEVGPQDRGRCLGTMVAWPVRPMSSGCPPGDERARTWWSGEGDGRLECGQVAVAVALGGRVVDRRGRRGRGSDPRVGGADPVPGEGGADVDEPAPEPPCRVGEGGVEGVRRPVQRLAADGVRDAGHVAVGARLEQPRVAQDQDRRAGGLQPDPDDGRDQPAGRGPAGGTLPAPDGAQAGLVVAGGAAGGQDRTEPGVVAADGDRHQGGVRGDGAHLTGDHLAAGGAAARDADERRRVVPGRPQRRVGRGAAPAVAGGRVRPGPDARGVGVAERDVPDGGGGRGGRYRVGEGRRGQDDQQRARQQGDQEAAHPSRQPSRHRDGNPGGRPLPTGCPPFRDPEGRVVARHRSPRSRQASLALLAPQFAVAGIGVPVGSFPAGPHVRRARDAGAEDGSRWPASTRITAAVVAVGGIAATAHAGVGSGDLSATVTSWFDTAGSSSVSSQDAALPAAVPAPRAAADDAASPIADPATIASLAAPAAAPSAAARTVAVADTGRARAASAVQAATASVDQVRKAAEERARAVEAARAAGATGALQSASAGGAVSIVTGRVTSGFGSRWGTKHMGLDIAAPIGTPIHVPIAGTVISSGPASGRWRQASRSPRSATAASPPARTCTSRSSTRAEPRSTRSRGSTRTASATPESGVLDRLQRTDLVRGVQRGDLVGLRQRRVVQDGVDEVVHGPATAHDRLPDVHEVGGVRAEHVHAEQRPVLGRDDELQHAVGVADDRAAGELPVAGQTDLVRDRRLGQLGLGLPAERDLGDRVDADRLQLAQLADRLAERVVGGEPALVHARRRQRREADHVADRRDVLDRGPVLLVDLDAPPVVGPDTGRVQAQLLGHALPARRVHDHVGRDPLAAGQAGHRAAAVHLDRGHLLAEPERDRRVAQVELQRLHDLRVAEPEHRVPLLHHGHPRAERGEHRRVLDADHPGADDDHRVRDPAQLQHLVGVDDVLAVERDGVRAGRAGPGRDDEVRGGDLVVVTPPRPLDDDGVRVGEARRPGQDVDVVAHQLVAHHLDLTADHVLGARQQVSYGDLGLDPVAGPVHLPLGEPGQVEDGLAQGLRRDRAGVDADPAHHVAAVGHRHPLPELRRRDRGLLPTRPGADHHQVVVVGGVSRAVGASPFVGEEVRGLPGGGVERAVVRVEAVVDLAGRRVRLDRAGDRVPVAQPRLGPGRDGGQPRVAERGADGLLRHVLRDPGHVGDDPGPEPALHPAADGDQALRAAARGPHDLQVVPDAVRDALQRGPVDLAAGVPGGQPGEHAAGVRVEQGGPLPGEVGEQQQAAAARRHLRGLGDEPGEALPGEVAQPVRDRSGGRHPRGQGERPRYDAAGGPHRRVRVRAVDDLDEEHRRPVHHHDLPGAGDAGAGGLGPGVDGAGGDRQPLRQPGRGGRRRAHPPGDLGRPQQPGQRDARGGALGPVGRPVRGGQVVHRVALAGRVVVEHVLAGEPVHQVGRAHQEHLGAGEHLRLVPGEPPPLRPHRLRGQRCPGPGQDRVLAQLRVQLVDLGAGAGVDAVEDRRAQRAAVAVGGEQGRPDPRHPQPGELGAVVEGGQQLPHDRDEVAPPDGLGVVLHVAGQRLCGLVRPVGPGQHPAAGVDEDALRTRRTDVDAQIHVHGTFLPSPARRAHRTGAEHSCRSTRAVGRGAADFSGAAAHTPPGHRDRLDRGRRRRRGTGPDRLCEAAQRGAAGVAARCDGAVAVDPARAGRPADRLGRRRRRPAARPPQVPRRAVLAGVRPPPLRPARHPHPLRAARGPRPRRTGMGRAVARRDGLRRRLPHRAAHRRLAGEPDPHVAVLAVDRARRARVGGRGERVLRAPARRLPRGEPARLAVDRRRRHRQALRLLPLAGPQARPAAVRELRAVRRLPDRALARRSAVAPGPRARPAAALGPRPGDDRGPGRPGLHRRRAGGGVADGGVARRRRPGPGRAPGPAGGVRVRRAAAAPAAAVRQAAGVPRADPRRPG
ncbi:hypothetical protein L7F22_000092 [Adiantum nelumboides]|nr:hypothetical protein [Adiantum nelumboides]